MKLWEKVKLLLQSRKFWALVAGIVTAAGAQATGQITTWEMVQAIVAGLGVYSASIAYVDGNAGAPLRVAEAAPVVPAVVTRSAPGLPQGDTTFPGSDHG